jgi:hypothetical protein
MAFSGGVFSKLYSWVTEQASPPIEISKLDAQEADIAAGLSNCILRDGTGLPTAAIDFNGQKITNLGTAAAGGDALSRTAGDARYVLSSVAGAVISGTYTPTLTHTSNIASSTPAVIQYMRVGNVVTVSGSAGVQCTSGVGVATTLGVSLPVASDLAAFNQLGGAGAHNSSPVSILGNASSNVAALTWFSSTVGLTSVTFSFSYLVV